MTPPNSIAPGITVNPPASPVANPANLPSVPTYNLVEIQAGASFAPGQSTQGQLRFVLQPLGPNFRTGLTLGSNFSDSPFSASLQAGPRISVSDLMSISLLGEFGFGILSDSTNQQGRLQEEVLRNGVRYLLGLTVQLDANLSQRVGLYFTASALAAINDSLRANPGTLRTDEAINSTEFILQLGAGIRFGFVPRPSQRTEENEVPEPRPTPPPDPVAAARAAEALRVQQMQQSFDQRLDALQESFSAQIAAAERARIDEAINNSQTSIDQLRSRISQLSRGINEINQVLNVFSRVNDNLTPATGSLQTTDRSSLTQTLDTLEHALNPANNTDQDQGIRNALRYIPNSDSARPRYINSVITHLTSLESTLRARNEAALADRVARLKAQCERFSVANPQAITLNDLQADVQRMEASLQALETLIGSQNLTQNSNWQNIRTALNGARDEVNLMLRCTDFFNQLRSELSNGGGPIMGVIDTPQNAQTHFRNARGLIQRMSRDPARRVDMAQMNRQFGLFMEVLNHNLLTFIQQHTPPVMSGAAALRQWHAALQAAHDLACQIDTNSTACRTTIPPAAPASAPRRPAHPTVPARPVTTQPAVSAAAAPAATTPAQQPPPAATQPAATVPRPATPVTPAPATPARPAPVTTAPTPPAPPTPATTGDAGTTHRIRLRPTTR